MAIDFGKKLPFLSYTTPGVAKGSAVSGAQAPKLLLKNANYASIPYERAPQVKDTVPTKDAAGNPLLAGYITPEKVWVA